jgi:hypothetical protein
MHSTVWQLSHPGDWVAEHSGPKQSLWGFPNPEGN